MFNETTILDNLEVIESKLYVPLQPDGRRRPRTSTAMPPSNVGTDRDPGLGTFTTTVGGAQVKTTRKLVIGSEGHDHTTDHGDRFQCAPISSQHSEFIRQNLGTLQHKCGEFEACINELYGAENFHTLLSGEDIQLKNICGLIYISGGGQYTTLNEKCSTSEREAIRSEVGRKLQDNLASPPNDGTKPMWLKLEQCIVNKTDTALAEEPIDTVCRLRRNATIICGKQEIHTHTQKSFNHELKHMHCTCKAIQAEIEKGAAQDGDTGVLSQALKTGIGAGIVGLIVFLIILVGVLCYKHRKVKRRLSKQKIQYLPSPHGGESSAIYQEIGDSNSMSALRKERAVGNPLLPGYNYNYLGPAPALPDRYVKPNDMARSRENLASPHNEDFPEYLEPIPDPRSSSSGEPPAGPDKGVSGKREGGSNGGSGKGGSGRGGEGGGFGGSSSGRKTEGPYYVAQLPGMPGGAFPVEGTYFSRVDRAASQDEDGGYDTLGKKDKAAKENSGDSGVGSTTGAAHPGLPEEDEDAFSDETESLNQPSQKGEVSSPQYFVLEPEKGSLSPIEERRAPLSQTEESVENQRPRRYRPKRPNCKDASTIV